LDASQSRHLSIDSVEEADILDGDDFSWIHASAVGFGALVSRVAPPSCDRVAAAGWYRNMGSKKTGGAQERRLGGGIAVFPIGLGCMGMSGPYGPADESESIATIDAAIDQGVNLIDTDDCASAPPSIPSAR
jgi:hypothetical protein